MRFGKIEQRLILDAQANNIIVPKAKCLRGNERLALERLQMKGIIIDVGGVYFLTDLGKTL